MELLDEYLTRDDLARQLGVSRRTVERWDMERTGPARTKVGVQTLYHLDDVKTWLRGRRQEAPRARAAG